MDRGSHPACLLACIQEFKFLQSARDIFAEHLLESLVLQEDRAHVGLKGQTKVRRQLQFFFAA